jgi:CNT family concentrative nucleoside transporter
MDSYRGVLGIVVLCAIAWAVSEGRRAVPWRTVTVGIALQLAVALTFLRLPLFRDAFLLLNRVVAAVQEATAAGTAFVFGYIGGAAPPFAVAEPGNGFILAFQALPLVVVVGALSAILHHWRILPAIVNVFAWMLARTMGIGGAAGVATAANVFVGMVEAPLLVRPYVAAMSRSELFVVMTAGMATIAGTVMVIYATFLQGLVPDPIGQLLTASVMSAPAAVAVALIMVPGDAAMTEGKPPTLRLYDSTMDAVTRGTLDGLSLLLNIAALLLVLVALVHLANALLGVLPDVAGAPVTLQRVLGLALAPLAWTLGIPWAECATAGALLGTKVVLNEFLAYVELKNLPPDALSAPSRLILTYALCGFANFASLGIMLGGLGAMAPERRGEIIGLGMKSILSGLLASCMTGAVVGLL